MAKYNVGSPMEHIAIDMLGPLPITETGNKYILIVADYFTKWVHTLQEWLERVHEFARDATHVKQNETAI